MGREDSSEFVIMCRVDGGRARSCRVSGRIAVLGDIALNTAVISGAALRLIGGTKGGA